MRRVKKHKADRCAWHVVSNNQILSPGSGQQPSLRTFGVPFGKLVTLVEVEVGQDCMGWGVKESTLGCSYSQQHLSVMQAPALQSAATRLRTRICVCRLAPLELLQEHLLGLEYIVLASAQEAAQRKVVCGQGRAKRMLYLPHQLVPSSCR